MESNQLMDTLLNDESGHNVKNKNHLLDNHNYKQHHSMNKTDVFDDENHKSNKNDNNSSNNIYEGGSSSNNSNHLQMKKKAKLPKINSIDDDHESEQKPRWKL
jgi:hypothetical protein